MVRLTFAVLALVASTSLATAQPLPSGPSVIVAHGEATLKRAPDQAWVMLASESRASKPGEAQRLAAVAMTSLQSALKAVGLAADAVRTTNYSLEPDMEYSGGSSRVKGYIARNQIEVRVDALDKLGTVLDAAGSSGATSIAGMRFDIKDRNVQERDALRLSVRDAMSRAESMAAGAGRTLGPIVRLEEQGEGPSVPMPYMTMTMRAPAPAQTPITPGEIEIKARVTVTVEIR